MALIPTLLERRRAEGWQAENPTLSQALLGESLTAIELAAAEAGRAVGERRQLEARHGNETWARLPALRLEVAVIVGGRYDGIALPGF